MTEKPFLEDLFFLAENGLNHLADARHELKAQAKSRADSFARDLGLVGRSEFDVAFAMLAKARAAQEDLEARVLEIESFLKLSSAKKTVKTKKANLRIVKTKKKLRARK